MQSVWAKIVGKKFAFECFELLSNPSPCILYMDNGCYSVIQGSKRFHNSSWQPSFSCHLWCYICGFDCPVPLLQQSNQPVPGEPLFVILLDPKRSSRCTCTWWRSMAWCLASTKPTCWSISSAQLQLPVRLTSHFSLTGCWTKKSGLIP